MTPARWAATPFPLPLIRYLADDRRLDARRARLFACACARLVGAETADAAAREAIEAAEAFYDGRETAMGLDIAGRFVRQLCDERPDDRGLELAYLTTERTVNVLAVTTVVFEEFLPRLPPGPDAREVANRRLAHLVRDIFPYADVNLDPAWRTAAVVELVNGMNTTRDFAAMPVLADLLEEAGCVNEWILAHARGTADRHFRGCWVVDTIRNGSSGKST